MRIERVRYEQHGPVPEDLLTLVPVEAPELATGQTLVEVLAAPVNPADLLAITGEYGGAGALPATAGSEGVGRVLRHGPDTTGPAPGSLVLLPFGSGTWATHLVADTPALMALPADADTLQLAMLTCNPAAALLMLEEYVALDTGDWVIQDAANSGVGGNVIQLARRRGLRTVNIVRRESARDAVVTMGGDVVLVDGDELAERATAATGGAPIRLGLDAVGGAATGRLAGCLAEGGQLVNYGLLSGDPCMVAPFQLIFRSITLRGFWRAQWFRRASPERRAGILGELSALVADGSLYTPVHATFPLQRVAEAVRLARSGGRSGKVLLVPGAG